MPIFTVNDGTEWLNFRFNQLPSLRLHNLLNLTWNCCMVMESNGVTVESTDSEAG